MGSGIYCIYFNTDNNLYYVGQTIDFDTRFKRHLNQLLKGTHYNKFLQKDFDKYGIPSFEILEIINDYTLLDIKEIYWIKQFNSFNKGYNKTSGGSKVLGEDNPNALYSKETYINIAKMLASSNKTNLEIAKELNVSNRVVDSISSKQSHIWLEEVVPEIYYKAVQKKNNIKDSRKELHIKIFLHLVETEDRIKDIATLFNVSVSTVEKIAYGTSCKFLQEEYPEKYLVLLNKIGTRRVKAARKEPYPLLMSPTGIIYQINNIREFSRIHGLQQSNLTSVINGKKNSHKGWTLYK